MSNPVVSSINKIHINNSTKMTLSDRFTAFSAQPKIQPRTSRRSVDSPVSRVASIANRRLLKQLAQKHTREAALKLKRRSMKQRPQTAAYNRVSNGVPLKRGSIKTLRLGPSGHLMKANSITNVATMEADFLGRAPRRSNSASRITERIGGGGGGGRRNVAPIGNGGARRIGRPLWRQNAQANFDRTPPPRMRSRSRSRTRRAVAILPPSSSQPGIGQRMASRLPLRSNSRPRPLVRSRSRTGRIDRTRRLMDMRGLQSVPITSRLGVRPNTAPPSGRSRSVSRGRPAGSRFPQREGRIQKRRNSVKPVTARVATLANSVHNRLNRVGGRYTAPTSTAPVNRRLNASVAKTRGNVTRGRTRSRNRGDNRTTTLQRNNGTAVRGGPANRQKRGTAQTARGRGGVTRGTQRRGRSQLRGAAATGGALRSGQQPQPQPQRRGRSRSRGRGRGSARGGGRQLGQDNKPDVKKEDLDKELDQYMSSTKASDVPFS